MVDYMSGRETEEACSSSSSYAGRVSYESVGGDEESVSYS